MRGIKGDSEMLGVCAAQGFRRFLVVDAVFRDQINYAPHRCPGRVM
jgi:hypothetical protein